jgi:hypothetical protein
VSKAYERVVGKQPTQYHAASQLAESEFVDDVYHSQSGVAAVPDSSGLTVVLPFNGIGGALPALFLAGHDVKVSGNGMA